MTTQEEIHSALERTLQHEQWPNQFTFDQFLRLLTWQSNHEPAFDMQIATELQTLVDAAKWRGPTGSESVYYNREELLILTNRIRERLGLKLLKQDRTGFTEVIV